MFTRYASLTLWLQKKAKNKAPTSEV
jgi:hypothetical protein